MNCNEAEALVAAYADGEIDGLRRYSLARHLRDCAQCAAQHRDVLALRARLRSEVPYYAAPPGTREQVLAQVAGVPAAAPHPSAAARQRWRWLAAGVVTGAVATVLAWLAGTALVDWRADEDLTLQAVSIHVRATLDEHLVAVASSDQHTVKPWLSARLDYSPPVRDFAKDGFPLIGGRIDRLARQPVATLVYRYRKHTIDVFVRPAVPGTLANLRTIRGFNVVGARGSGWEWLAVSDASADVLSAFVRRLASESPSP